MRDNIQIITAPNNDKPIYNSVFLAGGISNCKEWQKEVINYINEQDIELTIFNPRRENFDISDKNVSVKQIKLEFDRLEKMDIFSMYFCNDNSDQPICMYELGRNIVRMQNRFPYDWSNRIIISIEKGYKREEDVFVQTSLCAPSLIVDIYANPFKHAKRIKGAAAWLKYMNH